MSANHVDPDSSYERKATVLGAPRLRWNRSVISVAILMIGIMLIGIGAVVIGFMWQEIMPLAAGCICLIVGVALAATGTVFLFFPNLVPTPRRASYAGQWSAGASQEYLHSAPSGSSAAPTGSQPPPTYHQAMMYPQRSEPGQDTTAV